MPDTSYAHCITGQPKSSVLCVGKVLARFDSIRHIDGSLWRYEGLARSNTVVTASKPGDPALRRFAMSEFGIVVVVDASPPLLDDRRFG